MEFIVDKDSLQVCTKSNNKWRLYIWLQTQMLAFKGIISLEPMISGQKELKIKQKQLVCNFYVTSVSSEQIWNKCCNMIVPL